MQKASELQESYAVCSWKDLSGCWGKRIMKQFYDVGKANELKG